MEMWRALPQPPRPALTVERVREVLTYSPDTGLFTRNKTGEIAQDVGKRGYPRVAIDGWRPYGHHLAFFYMTGEWPPEEVDHINGIRTDNRWENIRLASRKLNAQNQRKPRGDNKSGYLGVSFCKEKRKWVARIHVAESYKFLGRFNTKEAARDAYLAAKRKYHEGCTI